MSYIYDALKQLLGEEKKDYTPNEVKSIFIFRDFIFIVRHVKPYKMVKLNSNLFLEDAQLNGSKGAIHNLLSQRQLSCLEELYYDPIFLQCKGAFDVEAYIGKVKTEKSRLRYYGVIGSITIEELIYKYSNPSYDYAYVEDNNKAGVINAKRVGNEDWYHNYNLRPKMYSADSKKGKLYIWFSKAEKYIEDERLKELREVEVNGRMTGYYVCYNQDLVRSKMIYMLVALMKYCRRSTDYVCKSVGKYINNRISSMTIKGLDPNELKEALKSKHEKPNSGLLNAYASLKVFDTKNSGIELEELVEIAKEGYGFFRLNSLLMNICYDFYTSMESNKLVFLVCYDRYREEIPYEKLSEEVGMKTTGEDCIGYLKLLLGLCGWDYESFAQYMTECLQVGGKSNA